MPKATKSKSSKLKQTNNNNKRAKRSVSPLPESSQARTATQSLRQSVEPRAGTPQPFTSSRAQSLEPSSRPSSRGRSVEFVAGSRKSSRSRKSTTPPPPPSTKSPSSSLVPPPDTSTSDTNVLGAAQKGPAQGNSTVAPQNPPLQRVDPETNTDIIALENFLAINAMQKLIAENDILELKKVSKGVAEHPAVFAKFMYSKYEGQERTARIAELGVEEQEFDDWIASEIQDIDPEEVSALESSLRHIPQPQSIIRMPNINWAKYGLLPQKPNIYNAQNPELVGPINLAMYRLPDPPPFNPAPTDTSTNVPKDGYKFTWKQLEGSNELRSNPNLDDYARLQKVEYQNTDSPL